MAGNQPTLLLKSQNNINLYKKFNSQLNLTKIFAKYAYWQASPVEFELGTAQPQLVICIYDIVHNVLGSLMA